MAQVRGQRYSLNKTKYLLEPEAQSLEDTLKRFADQDGRNVLLIELALKTGARAQEILNITKQDLNSFEETVLIRGLKGSSDREIPLPRGLFERLLKFANTVPGEKIFDVTYNRFRDIWVMYRPVHKKLHALRHTFAIRLFKKTKDLRLVQLALGHRNITNTMVYADYIYSQNELRKLIL
ncbi:MAG: tyrosine-type recombinase/integrase [Oligoflexia bacterium]|nr:tyrosine-type recombinase/integrase [Oligoflexia bacterium]